MDLGIKGKRALVTGAGRGLGKSIALNLAKEGVKVAIVSRTESDLNEVLNKMGGKESGHYAITIDLSIEQAPRKVIEELKEHFGDIDILINNVGGTLNITDPFCSIHDWRRIYRINLETSIELSNLVIPQMKNKNWGRIVNISSISGKENHGPVPYCSMKAALNAYTRSMGRLLSPEGIVMTAILSGAVFTEKGYWDFASKEKPEHVKKFLDERIAIKRFGTLEEIGAVTTFLCSKQASFCVGSLVTVDGGQGRGFF